MFITKLKKSNYRGKYSLSTTLNGSFWSSGHELTLKQLVLIHKLLTRFLTKKGLLK